MMESGLRLYSRNNLQLALLFAVLFSAFSVVPLAAQSAIVFVNDDPISSLDVSERQRWMSLTRGFGERMKAAVATDAVKNKFREMMIAANPRTQEEALKARDRIQKQLLEDVKRRVMIEGAASARKEAIDALIEDRLKLQAAKKLGFTVTDAEVEETLASQAGKTGAAKTQHLAEFYAKFESEGISRKTIQNIYRAQLAWRDVIRRQFGPRIQSALASTSNADKKSNDDLTYDVRIANLPVSDTKDEKAVGRRLVEAQNLQEKISSCADLQKQTKLISDLSIKAVEKAKITSFPKDVQPLIARASEGQMTPPRLVGNTIQSYTICKKVASAKSNTKNDEARDIRQQEYERFSKSYIQELKRSACIDYRDPSIARNEKSCSSGAG